LFIETLSLAVPDRAELATSDPLDVYTYRSKLFDELPQLIETTDDPVWSAQYPELTSTLSVSWSHSLFFGSIDGGHADGDGVAPRRKLCPVQPAEPEPGPTVMDFGEAPKATPADHSPAARAAVQINPLPLMVSSSRRPGGQWGRPD
jgi:hypothetical protein